MKKTTYKSKGHKQTLNDLSYRPNKQTINQTNKIYGLKEIGDRSKE